MTRNLNGAPVNNKSKFVDRYLAVKLALAPCHSSRLLTCWRHHGFSSGRPKINKMTSLAHSAHHPTLSPHLLRRMLPALEHQIPRGRYRSRSRRLEQRITMSVPGWSVQHTTSGQAHTAPSEAHHQHEIYFFTLKPAWGNLSRSMGEQES